MSLKTSRCQREAELRVFAGLVTAVSYPLQVEAADLLQAPEPPDSTDVLPVQAEGRGGRQLGGSGGRGVLGVSLVHRDPRQAG